MENHHFSGVNQRTKWPFSGHLEVSKNGDPGDPQELDGLFHGKSHENG